jgi:hypothetical protein
MLALLVLYMSMSTSVICRLFRVMLSSFFDKGSFYYVSSSLHRVDTIIMHENTPGLCILECTQPIMFKGSIDTLVSINA